MNKVFVFWESKDGYIPAYLELCKNTWIKNIPDLEIVILNHGNLKEYLGDIYNLDQLKKISLPMQSDVISAAILEKFGGLFLDLDCIVTENIFDYFNSISPNKLIGFGAPGKGMHLAVLYSRKPNNPILKKWRVSAQERLNNLPEKYDWSYFGNSILNPLLQSEMHKNDCLIIDRTKSGNILESSAMLDSTYANSKEYYKNFYFNKNFKLSDDITDFVKFGVISLHNSWTPTEYKIIKDKPEFYATNTPIAKLLKDIISDNYKRKYMNKYYLISALESRVSEKGIDFRLREIKDLIVIDFLKNGFSFAFDIKIEGGILNLDLVVRDTDEKLHAVVTKLDFLDFNESNKVKVASSVDLENILDYIFKIYKLI